MLNRDDATQRQVDAARPSQSTWLAANAGSGKTRVLTDRVARLLLDGVDPSHILCLTYTKAAASEMQNRLFRRLGGWAMSSDPQLRSELEIMGVDVDLTSEFLQDARTLFARAIETPGGLRIQTIHSFCASLLRRFPLEAQVSPQFKEMEDRAAELLRAEILDGMADGEHAHLVRGIAPFIADTTSGALLYAIAGLKDAFATPKSAADLRADYGIDPDLSLEELLSQVFLGGELELINSILPTLIASGGNNEKAAQKLANITSVSTTSLEKLENTLLTGASAKSPFTAKVNSFPTKALREGELAPYMDRLNALMLRVETARDARLALIAAEKDHALHQFAQVFLATYEHEKQLRGWLDFDDLITRARDLLSDPRVAEWVLYRLDGGIDHILVDEAQDTSPVQWQVIERLAHEFTSGEGARSDIRRTIFVVGDKKQSIYSFQGADPSEFDRMREEFRDRLSRAEEPLHAMVLEYSFRSASPILKVVDETFDGAISSGFTEDQRHKAFKSDMPGRVDLWPVIEATPPDKDEEGAWFEPLDRVGAQHHSVLLAQRIAGFIRETIEAKTPLPIEIGHSGRYQARPVHAGDFLILVRSRGRLFKEIIRACKQENLPIAGADRLKVMSELAVRDVIALLSFLATPEDSLSLATALRSPLFGISEEQLFDLAHRRTRKYLWEGLRDRKDDFPEVMQVLDDLMGQTDFLRPYDLIERILTHHDGRKRLIGRLGQEAEDGVNALLGQALAYEQTTVPSLTGFLEWAQADNLEIKRAPDAAGTTLRVMTVHGSKGLEAPIVILPDCAPSRKDNQVKSTLLRDKAGVFWKQSANSLPTRQAEAVERARDKDAQERDRLLYVAMTRAERWLIMAAAGDLGKDGTSWYHKAQLGMTRAGATERGFHFGELGQGAGLSLTHLNPHDLAVIEQDPRAPKPTADPLDLPQPLPDPPQDTKTVAPSDLGGAKALPGMQGDEEELAKARGTALHLMLELLAPLTPDQRGDMIPRLVAHLSKEAETEIAAPIMDVIASEALSVLSDQALAFIFSPDGLSEVPITADIAGIGRLHGLIDRLIVTHDRVIAVDFKTNRNVPQTPDQTPEGILRQMGAYAAALAQIYPGRQIETGVLWTANNHYMPLSGKAVTQALERAGAS
jgi:ATP-dependent helicase/nuclease subunit A